MPHVLVSNRKIHYQDSGGGGTPLLLLHAFPLASKMWEPQVESLSDRFRMIRPDFLGFGESDAPDSTDEYTVEGFADQAKAVLDDAGAESAVVVGLSLGGYVAFAFHRRHRDAVQGLVLADTRAEADAPENVEKRTSQQQLVREQGPDALTDGLVGALLSPTTRANKLDVVEDTRALMRQPAAGYIGALEAMKRRPDSSGDLASIAAPALVIVGEADAITPPDLSRKLHEHIGGSRLVVIPEAGHLSNLEAPEVFNGALAEFLSEL